MSTMWIVAANTEEFGRIYLPNYCGLLKHDVEIKVIAGALREGFVGTLAERLGYLKWEIVCLNVSEADQL